MLQLSQHFGADEAGHLDVEKYKLGSQPVDRIDSAQTVRRFARHSEPVDAREHVAKSGSCNRFVVGDDDCDSRVNWTFPVGCGAKR